MSFRFRSLLAVAAASLALAACGGGGTTVQPNPNPNPGPPGPAGSVSLSTSEVDFASAASASQTVTLSTTVPSPAPVFNPINCGTVATITSTGVGSFSYTVTPNGTGTCVAVFTVANVSTTLTITVGGTGGVITTTNSAVAVSVGGSGSFSASASSGTWTIDGTSCHNIANLSTTSTGASVTYNIAPVAAGTCTATLINTTGRAMVLQPIVVSAGNSASTLTISPAALAFSAASDPGPKTFTISINGTAGLGALTTDESSCWNGQNTGTPRIAFVTLNGSAPGTSVTPPATFTVTLFTAAQGGQTGSCAINFSSGGVVFGSLPITVGP
jgi:hypothetical protein